MMGVTRVTYMQGAYNLGHNPTTANDNNDESKKHKSKNRNTGIREMFGSKKFLYSPKTTKIKQKLFSTYKVSN